MTPLAHPPTEASNHASRVAEVAPRLEAKARWHSANTAKMDGVPASSRRSSTLKFVLAILLAATLAGVIFSFRHYVLLAARNPPIPRPYRLFFFEMVNWYLWVPFSPFALWLMRRPVRWPILLGASIGAWLTHLVANVAVRSLIVLVFFQNREAFAIDRLSTQFRNGLTIDSIPSLLTFLALVCAAYAWHQNERSIQLEAELSRAELQALRAQLQPHFLFNTLNSISVLVEDDPKGANTMLLHLSDILRVMMHRTGTQEVSLREELELIRSYLEIEQVRFGSRLTVRFESDPEALEARVPSLLLQPLVENAVRHGIAPRSTPGLIEINTQRNNGSVRIIVRDNGGGMPADKTKSAGVGLRNTRARLELLYGTNHQFVLQNLSAGGLESLIEIPYRA